MICPFADQPSLTLALGETVFFASRDTRTLCQVTYKKVRLSDPAPRIDLQEEAPV